VNIIGPARTERIRSPGS